jgi:Ser/Thr protein kinase RdoA (MazF antagonist)
MSLEHNSALRASIMPPSDHDAGSVLKELGLDPGAAPLHALGQAGGFSGASLWRVESGHGSYCLRAWPPTMTADRIAFIHQAQAELTSAGLEFIPALHASRAGATWVCRDNRYWELAGWRPGAADFRQRPNPQRLRNAVTALARVHAVWARGRSAAAGPSQAVRQRHERLRAWDDAAFQRAAAALRQIQDPVSARWRRWRRGLTGSCPSSGCWLTFGTITCSSAATN